MTAQFRCRSCDGVEFYPVVSLGDTPLANALLGADDLLSAEDRFPLVVVGCRGCSLVQITETVPPERLFRHYAYFSSFSDTMLDHASRLVSSLVAERSLGAGSLAMEVASNDGYLLQQYLSRGVPVLGIEPAQNIAAVARDRGIDTITEFFGAATAASLAAGGRFADVLHAHNVLAHVPDLRGFVEGVRLVLAPAGIAVIEVPYVKELLDRCEFDTIYHEHLSYFSLTALDRLWRAGGLRIVNVERVAIHGGSLRLFIEHDRGQAPSPAVAALLAEEEGWGVREAATYAQFGERVAALGRELTATLRRLKDEGARIAAYGAAAKGSTLLNVFGLDGSLIDFVVDRSPHKQGRYMPGVHLPIYPPAHLLATQPEYVLLLSWNVADEVLTQQAEYRGRGGHFIVPVPTVRIV